MWETRGLGPGTRCPRPAHRAVLPQQSVGLRDRSQDWDLWGGEGALFLIELVAFPHPWGCLGAPPAAAREWSGTAWAAYREPRCPHRRRPLRPQGQPPGFELSRQPCSAPAPFPKRPTELSEAWAPAALAEDPKPAWT